jgi:uncharacterized protein Yka (UPF0111/DUF47 family)
MTLGLFIESGAWSPQSEGLQAYGVIDIPGNRKDVLPYSVAAQNAIKDWDLEQNLRFAKFFNKYKHEKTGVVVAKYESREDGMQIGVYHPVGGEEAAKVLHTSIEMALESIDYDGKDWVDERVDKGRKFVDYSLSALDKLHSATIGRVEDAVSDFYESKLEGIVGLSLEKVREFNRDYKEFEREADDTFNRFRDRLYGGVVKAVSNMSEKMRDVVDYATTPASLRKFEREMLEDQKIRSFLQEVNESVDNLSINKEPVSGPPSTGAESFGKGYMVPLETTLDHEVPPISHDVAADLGADDPFGYGSEAVTEQMEYMNPLNPPASYSTRVVKDEQAN